MIFSEHQINIEDFQNQNFQYYHFANNEEWKINVFFLFSDGNTISKFWKSFSDTIASLYQNAEYMSVNIEFEKWNFYIIYISKEKLSKELKNKIENDRFSSRKIVEDGYTYEFNNEEANRLIVKHITSTDLKKIIEKTQDKIQENYKPLNEELWKLIHKNISFDRNTDLQKQIVEQIIQLKDEN